MNQLSPKKIFAIGAAVVILLVALFASASLFENLDADQIMVVQDPISGKLTWHKDAGVKWQGFGKVTKYPKRSQYWFSKPNKDEDGVDQSIKVRFNDGGHATIAGSLAWEMPLSDEYLKQVHTKYGGPHAVEQQLVRTVVEKSIYMTGPLMSSKESYSDRRNELIQYIDDQVNNGVYHTTVREAREQDTMTSQQKTVKVVEITMKGGKPVRADSSPLQAFGIRTFNLSLNSIDYDGQVEKQIQAQQEMTMQVQTSIAEAKKAEQAAITAAKNGEAEAAKAKWAQEVVKAKEVTQAQQRLEVAELEKKAAEQTKQREILLGQGEAERKRLVMEADGALERKIDAVVRINERYAEAIEKHQGSWVPQVVMGSGAGGPAAQNGALPLVELLTARAAQDLALDLSIKGKK